MESGQVDQLADISVSPTDPQDSMVQDLKGQKVLATPAVRRLARENNVGILLTSPRVSVCANNKINKLFVVLNPKEFRRLQSVYITQR